MVDDPNSLLNQWAEKISTKKTIKKERKIKKHIPSKD